MKTSKKNKQRIFLDYASTTPVLPKVRQAMDKYLQADFYNPSAIYQEGVKARNEMNFFRKEAAKILHAREKDIIFTSGGTESNNLALLGVFEFFKNKISKPHIIISGLEHSSIIETAKEIERRGGEISFLSSDEEGRISLEDLKNSLKKTTILVSVMLANNEIGTIEPVSQVSRIVKEFRKKRETDYPFIHTDASQAANYLSVDISKLGVDMMSLDSSKIYGPKSSGILAVRTGVEIKPIVFGGGQERGLRSGTENLALISGFVTSLIIAQKDAEKESKRLNKLMNFLVSGIKKIPSEIKINTPIKGALPNILSLSFPGVLGELLAIKLDREGIMVSTGSSCGIYKDLAGSETIKAIGNPELSEYTVRFSLGRFTKKNDLEKAITALRKSLF
jgi:cysteine desulfurase